MAGVDVAPSLAVHPDGWAAVAWANYQHDRPEHADVYVKVQDRKTLAWPRYSLAVNTDPAYKHAGSPGIAIDLNGGVHVVWGEGGETRPHYSRSVDNGRTWSRPEQLAGDKGQNFRLALGPDNHVYILMQLGGKSVLFDRAADAAPGTRFRPSSALLPGQHNHGDLRFVGNRLVVAASCFASCPNGSRVVVAYRDGDRWRQPRIDGRIGQSDWQANWVSLTTDGDRVVCVAWSYYARPGTASSCSFDVGSSWEAAKPIAETTSGPFERQSSAPALVYDPANRTMVAVQLFREQREPYISYAIYSYRLLANDHWTPDLSGPEHRQQPPLRLFPTTPRTRAELTEGIRAAMLPNGLALVVWIERSPEQEVYSGLANLSALVTETQP
jgi:hypothetical protein